MNCEICNQEIEGGETVLTVNGDVIIPGVFHSCCYQEHFLFEVWNALSLGIKYESHCQHVDYASGFDPATFTPDDIIKGLKEAKR